MKTAELQRLIALQNDKNSSHAFDALRYAQEQLIRNMEQSLYYGSGADWGISERLSPPIKEDKSKKESLKNLLENV